MCLFAWVWRQLFRTLDCFFSAVCAGKNWPLFASILDDPCIQSFLNVFALPNLLEGVTPLAGCRAGTFCLGANAILVAIKQGLYESRAHGLKRLLGQPCVDTCWYCLYGYPGQCHVGAWSRWVPSTGGPPFWWQGKVVLFGPVFCVLGFFGVVRPHFQPTTFCLLMSWFQGLVDRAEDRRDPELQSLTVPCVHEMCFVNSLLYDLGCKVIVSILQNQLPYTSLRKSSNHFSVCGARLEENFFGVFAISIWVRL